MSHPRIEEVEDSDVEMSDPSEGDIDDFADEDIMRARPSTTVRAPAPASAAPSPPTPGHVPGANRFPVPPPGGQGPDYQQAASSPQSYSGYQIIYPVYFDATRSRAEGRRVPSSLAVKNPLAVEIASACQRLALQPVLEPTKLHPKDWANPGRVRVLLRASHLDGGNPVPFGAKAVKNKHDLFIKIARHLKANPTTEDSPALRWRLPGRDGMAIAPPNVGAKGKDGETVGWPKPAVPRGWKMGELVPYWSPAVTGGGVSENLFKDMMGAMGGGGAGAPGGMDMASLMSAMGGGGAGGNGAEASGSSSSKKEKKKGKGK
ncbi:signal recognition particle subunit [Coniochaeta pulveracea]|uniref:Signal recognition particle subunit n=1 Tax=Coniochaeta pulveracea TaxID=177199 RepID=A0A420Y644_9PEZI|nr:signal recognition particle subunit [Coniochaeta pulveracea]